MTHKKIIIFLFAVATIQSLKAQNASRISIRGSEIYSEQKLIQSLRLNRYRLFSRRTASRIKNRLRSYYRNRGYKHVRVFISSLRRRSLGLYIDEGKFDKIIFHNVGTIDLVKMKAGFNLPGHAYRKKTLYQEMLRLKKEYQLRRIYYRLKKTKNYSQAFFQFDRDITLLQESENENFKTPSARYELHIFAELEAEKKKGWLFGAKLDFLRGLIPYGKYKQPALFVKGDQTELGAALGIFYGLHLNFGNAPKWSYSNAYLHYKYKPILDNTMVPYFKLDATRKLEFRTDIGLEDYQDFKLKSRVGPGFTILENLELKLGYGLEMVFLGNASTLQSADLTSRPLNFVLDSNGSFLKSADTIWQVIQAEMKFNLNPNVLEQSLNQKVGISYDIYFGATSFNKIILEGQYDYEMTNFDIVSLGVEFLTLFADSDFSAASQNIPFYYEERISGPYFRGFIGRNYHTRRSYKFSGEYRTSVYKDFIYIGAFTDAAIFKGSGYDVSGQQLGLVGGLSAHFLIFSQLNFDLYFGRDILLSNGASQFNLYLNAFVRF